MICLLNFTLPDLTVYLVIAMRLKANKDITYFIINIAA